MSQSIPRLSWQAMTLKLRIPFRISYGVSATRQAFWLRLADDAGWGEAAIPPYYGISDESMIAYWQTIAQRSDPFPDDPSDIPGWMGEDGPAPARCALDLALHDRIGRLRGVPIYQLLNLPKPQPLTTAFTLSIDTPEEMARQATAVPNYPIIKLKLGAEGDVARVAAVRAARPDAILCVDANGGWQPDEAVALSQAILPYDLAFIEQPVPKGEIEAMGRVQAAVNIPVVADESVQTLANVEQLAAVGVQGINLKLMKLGGLAAALRIVDRAQELGLRLMLGCMMESSIGITAMAHLSGLAEWLDLDAPLLIANDPFNGMLIDENAQIHLPDRPGIGVVKV
ncbi:MAG: dipeptide epimerase [Ardenticatenaceae bacterium]|nr:dipeptide epimerase [Ardenticatenaceae bacterium]